MNEYGKLATAAARGGWHVHQHVINNSAVSDLLDTLEAVNRTQRVDRLRWTLGNVYDISPQNIARAKALGMTLGVHGAAMQAAAHMPLRKIADSGIIFGLILARFLILEQFKNQGVAEFVIPYAQVAVIGGLAFGFALLMTLLPSRQAASIPIAEALRYE